MTSPPVITAMIVLHESFDRIRKALRHLRAQTIADRIEVIIITTPDCAAQIPPDVFDAFQSGQVITRDHIPTNATAWAAAVRAANAPYVMIAEDHSFFEPTVLAEMVKALDDDALAASPAMLNANPGLISWADFLLSFGEHYAPQTGGERESLPGHNTAYQREILLTYEPLEQALISERMLHYALRAANGRLVMVAGTATHHINFSKPSTYFQHAFLGGQLFGVKRREGWSWPRRLMYAAAFPLVPLIRLRRLHEAVQQSRGDRGLFWRMLPILWIGLMCHAFGEAVGYVFDSSSSVESYAQFEMFRWKYVQPADQRLLQDPELP